jgi:cytochrome c biogenesis protein CcdA
VAPKARTTGRRGGDAHDVPLRAHCRESARRPGRNPADSASSSAAASWSSPSAISSSAILGATLTLVELPTAFPYLVALAAIVDSGLDPVRQLLLLTLFNVCFVLPLITIIAVLTLAGHGAERILAAARETLEHRWPVLVAGVAMLGGVAVVAFGIGGLIGDTTR